VKVQQCYLQVIGMRHEIERLDDSLMAVRKVDRVVYNGYRLLRKQTDLQPSFSTVERGRAFIDLLNEHIEMQQVCLTIVQKRRIINANEDKINDMASSYRNISKAYSRMKKAYDSLDEIANNEDLRRYMRQCDNGMVMQEAFKELLRSDYASSSDTQLKRETDIEKIKAVVGLK